MGSAGGDRSHAPMSASVWTHRLGSRSHPPSQDRYRDRTRDLPPHEGDSTARRRNATRSDRHQLAGGVGRLAPRPPSGELVLDVRQREVRQRDESVLQLRQRALVVLAAPAAPTSACCASSISERPVALRGEFVHRRSELGDTPREQTGASDVARGLESSSPDSWVSSAAAIRRSAGGPARMRPRPSRRVRRRPRVRRGSGSPAGSRGEQRTPEEHDRSAGRTCALDDGLHHEGGP